MSKPQVRITTRADAASGVFEACAHQLVNGSWEPVMLDPRAIEAHGNSEGIAREGAKVKLDGKFGKDNYELVP